MALSLGSAGIMFFRQLRFPEATFPRDIVPLKIPSARFTKLTFGSDDQLMMDCLEVASDQFLLTFSCLNHLQRAWDLLC